MDASGNTCIDAACHASTEQRLQTHLPACRKTRWTWRSQNETTPQTEWRYYSCFPALRINVANKMRVFPLLSCDAESNNGDVYLLTGTYMPFLRRVRRMHIPFYSVLWEEGTQSFYTTYWRNATQTLSCNSWKLFSRVSNAFFRHEKVPLRIIACPCIACFMGGCFRWTVTIANISFYHPCEMRHVFSTGLEQIRLLQIALHSAIRSTIILNYPKMIVLFTIQIAILTALAIRLQSKT